MKVGDYVEKEKQGAKKITEFIESEIGNFKRGSYKDSKELQKSVKKNLIKELAKLPELERNVYKLELITNNIFSHLDLEVALNNAIEEARRKTVEEFASKSVKPVMVHEIDQKKLNDLLEKAIPDKGFLNQYINIFSNITDCPKAFLFWGAMVTVATVLGKDVFTYWEARKLYPNIWCVFLAPSGTRKGTGIDFPVKLLKAVDGDLLLPSIGSEEGLTKVLDISKAGGREIGLIRWQEFARILSSWNSKKRTWKASQEYFIDIFDGKDFKKKLASEEFNVGETAVSFLGACIPASFNKYFTIEDIDSGFFGRVYLISVKGKDKYFAIPPGISEQSIDVLASQLREMRDKYEDQAMDYSDVKDIFTNWATDLNSKREIGHLDAFYSRIETHCIKLAMIYEACLSGDNSISKEAIEYAINALDFLTESARVMISETVGLNEEQRLILKIRDYIHKRKGVLRSEITRKFNLKTRQMTEIEETLLDRESIKKANFKDPSKNQGGRPSIIYYG